MLPATRLVEHIWVGYNQEVRSQETGGSGSSCGSMLGHDCHSTFKCLPSNSDDRYSYIIRKIFRRERVGPREPPAVEGASRMRVVFIHYPPSLSSAIAANHVVWWLSYSGKLHRAKIRIGFDLISFVFVYFLCFSRKRESLFVCFVFILIE